jgi:hypothetical protein
MPKSSFGLEEKLEQEVEKIRRIIGRAARTGAIETRKHILGGSPTGTQWHVQANARRQRAGTYPGRGYGARIETGKMIESVSFSRPKWDPATKAYKASFGFPYAEGTFGNIRNVRPSSKYAAKIDMMRSPNFQPWASDKNYFAMQEYGSEMPGSNVKRGMHATRRAMVIVRKQIDSEMSRFYKKGKK